MRRLMPLALLLLLWPSPLLAYYDDTHYFLTYFLARSCNYTPLQAQRLASATVSVDYSILEPLQLTDRLIHTVREARGSQHRRVLSRFHAMLDHDIAGSTGGTNPLTNPSLLIAAQAALQNRGKALRDQMINKGYPNFGIYLHFLQDSFSHGGYDSFGGHAFLEPSSIGFESASVQYVGIVPTLVWIWRDRRLPETFRPYGSATDWLAYGERKDLPRDPDSAQSAGDTTELDRDLTMIHATLDAMRDFRLAHEDVSDTLGCSPTQELAAEILKRLRAANPKPPGPILTKLDGAHEDTELYDLLKVSRLPILLDGHHSVQAPKCKEAEDAVKSALGELLATWNTGIPRVTKFSYDSDGAIRLDRHPGSPDANFPLPGWDFSFQAMIFPLYGTLTVRLDTADRGGEVEIIRKPTRRTEKPEVLRQAPVPADESGRALNDLPVGRVAACVTPSGRPSRRQCREVQIKSTLDKIQFPPLAPADGAHGAH